MQERVANKLEDFHVEKPQQNTNIIMKISSEILFPSLYL